MVTDAVKRAVSLTNKLTEVNRLFEVALSFFNYREDGYWPVR